MPASINPKNKGIALHEQNGVIIPKTAARRLPTYLFLRESIPLILSGDKNVLSIDTAKIIIVSKINIFIVSNIKKLIAEASSFLPASLKISKVSQSASNCTG
jgi:hypothetical protein